MNIFKMIKYSKKRDKIEDLSPVPAPVSSRKSLDAAKSFADRIHGEFSFIHTINVLLNSPLIKFDKDKHTQLTCAPISWLNDGKPLVVLFSIESCDPVCAYFEGDEE